MPFITTRYRGRRMMGKARIVGRRFRVGRGGLRAARARLSNRYNPVPTFTETFKVDPITYNETSPGNSTSQLINFIGQVPQISDYTNLYNQYCIRKVTAIFVPAYNVADLNIPAAATPVALPRMVYAIQNSAIPLNPATESDVLQDNGAKIRMFDRPIKVSWRPQPATALAQVSGGFAAVNTRGFKWFTTTDTAVVHQGLAVSFTNDVPITGTPVLAQVYIKMTFSLRDPK